MIRQATFNTIIVLSLCPLVLATTALAGCTDEETAAAVEEVLEEPSGEWVERELEGGIRFAIIGDYGLAGANEQAVADLVKSWEPEFLLTMGDNNYPDGSQLTIDQNIGQYYSEFIFPYMGSYGSGSPTDSNRFFPTLGNHDTMTAEGQAYLQYFTLPGGQGAERYYDFVWGPVHFFAINSDSTEDDGRSSTSVQGQWLQQRLQASTAKWKVVYCHHPPYSSGKNHGSTTIMQWPFEDWGADAVIAGHDHTYERIIRDGFTYFVNGLGGRSRYSFGSVVSGSIFRYNEDYGAQLVEANDELMIFRFYSKTGALIDTYTMVQGAGDVVTTTFASAQDTYIAESYPTTNYANAPTIKLDGDVPTGTGRDYRGLIRWDVSSIPAGSTVTSATLTVSVENSAPGETYEIVELLRSWNETQATWNLAAPGSSWGSPGASSVSDRGSEVLGTMSRGSTGTYTVSLNGAGIAVVQDWVDTPSSNHGLMIFDTGAADQLELYQSENKTASWRPRLTITYVP